MEKRNRYTAEFKAKIVIELLQEKSTLNQVVAKYQLNPQMFSQWKSDFIKKASVVFERNKDEAGKLKKEMEGKESRYKQIIGQQLYEIYWLKRKSGSSSTIEARMRMADLGINGLILPCITNNISNFNPRLFTFCYQILELFAIVLFSRSNNSGSYDPPSVMAI